MTTFAGYPEAKGGAVSEFAIVGAPCDLGVPGMGSPGQRMAPWAIRSVGEYEDKDFVDPYTGFDYAAASVLDYGDIGMVTGNLNKSHGEIRKRMSDILKRCKKFVVFGGDDSINIPVLKAAMLHSGHNDPLDLVLHLDAHNDISMDPDEIDHGAWVSHVLRMGYTINLFQYGVRAPCNPFVFSSIQRMGLTLVKPHEDVVSTFTQLAAQNKKTILCIDIDVVDPPYAPGTGYPEAFGMRPLVLRELVRKLAPDLWGMTVTEVLPANDVNDMTAQLANRIALDFVQYSSST